MNIQHLYYFKSLAKHEHYMMAAEEQLTSASSINYAISSIEKEIGLPLFQKSGRNIELSRYGYIFLGYVNDILKIYEKSMEDMKYLKQEILGKSVIGSLASLSFDFLYQLLDKFNNRQNSRNVQFEVLQMDTAKMVESIKKGEVSTGFALRVEDPDIISYPILKEEFVLIAPKGRYAIEGQLDNLSDFIGEKFISFHQKFPMYRTINKIYENYNFSPEIIYYVTSDIMLADFVSNGLGVAITSYCEKLTRLNVDIFHFNKKYYRTLSMLWSKNMTINASDKRLRKFVLEELKQMSQKSIKQIEDDYQS